ncbi:MAG: GTPase ObgE [Alkalispirochaeta sp.]
MFTDEAEIFVRSGHGGAGAVSFRREKYVPKGGPDGGDGGRGGDVVFVVKENVKTLSHLKMQQRFFAQNGRSGAGRQKDGAKGADVVIEVPPGTAVYDAESGEQLLDLTDTGSRTVLYEGGRGGKGNTHFKSSRHQTPRFAQPGEEGVEKRLRVELQIIADIGFVGLPNAGKSTLLKVLTAANPKIGNYPFTTVIPNLGVLHQFDRDIVLADIPGIIEGAGQGVGLGIKFLKHIARTKGLAFVIDVGDTDPVEAYRILQSELSEYSRQLGEKRRIVVLTKQDRIDSGEVDAEVANRFTEGNLSPDPDRIVLVSAMADLGIDRLRSALAALATATDEPDETETER